MARPPLLLSALIVLLLLAGCGNKGPLTLPERPAEPARQAPE